MKTTYYKFESLSQMAYTLETRKVNRYATKFIQNVCGKGIEGEKSKYVDKLRRRIAFGDPEYMEQVTELEREIKGIVGTKHTYQIQNSYVGQIPNVGRYCAGLPDCMYNLQRTPTRGGKVMTIIYYNGKTVGTSNDEQARLNLIVCKAISKLEAQGYFINLYLACGAKSTSDINPSLVHTWTKIKGSGEKIDLRKISYAMLNPEYTKAIMYLCACTDKFTMSVKEIGFAKCADRANYAIIQNMFPGCKAIFSHELKGKTEDEIIESLLK